MREVEDTAKIMDKTWETVQTKTFTKWVNNKLPEDSPKLEDLFRDLSSGVILVRLLETIGDASLGRYNKNPRMRIQKIENINKALEFVRERGIHLTNIAGEDIVDENSKLILGMLWTVILRFSIANINTEGLSAKEGLLLWCQRKTAPYNPEVDVRDFTFSWMDGLAFCALIHRHRPDLLDYHGLDKTNRHKNTELAFDVAERFLNIPKLLDVEDVCDIGKPDERSVMTYVAQYFHAFSSLDKVETAGRRVGKFAEVMASAWEMQHDYQSRASKFIGDVNAKRGQWDTARFDGSYTDAKNQSHEFTHYKNTQKRQWVAEKRDLDALLSNVQTKLKTYNLRSYSPPTGLTLKDLDTNWENLLVSEVDRRKKINVQLRSVKEALTKEYAMLANDLQRTINGVSAELAAVDGDLERQRDVVKRLSSRLGSIERSFQKVRQVDQQCIEANIEENDYTVYSVDDLSFDLGLLQTSVNKKLAFIENQIVSRSMTNLTPAQLDEFESTFRHFNKDGTNVLGEPEFKASLSSLGVEYSDTEFPGVFHAVSKGRDHVTFEQFINHMVSITEDQTTPEQLRQSFKAVAGDKDYVKEEDLRRSQLPGPVVTYLLQSMPRKADGYDYQAYLDSVFG